MSGVITISACWHHAVSSAKKWGGAPEDFLTVHKWFDEPKDHFGDFRQRALRHHSYGIAQCVEHFGETLTLSTGRVIPTRVIAEQHVIEDLGYIPSVKDWLVRIEPAPWMARGVLLKETDGP